MAWGSAVAAVALVAGAVALIPRGPAPTSVATQTDGNQSPSLKVTASPSQPAAGQLVTFKVVEQGGSILKGIYLDFGDGTPGDNGMTSEGYVCGARTPGPRERTFEHAYHGPGDFVAVASAVLVDPCATEGQPSQSRVEQRVQLRASGPAATSTNGPVAPALYVNDNMSDGAATMTATRYVSATDDDGFVSRFDFDWGDGSPRSVLTRDLAKCSVGANGWPARDNTPYQESSTHTYSSAGTFVVTVTVTTVGCDGRSVQTSVRQSQFKSRLTG